MNLVNVQNPQSVRQLAAAARTASVGRILIVGASGSGKSSFRQALRALLAGRSVGFPLRFVSRERRLDDEADENRHLLDSQFPVLFDRGELDFYWASVPPEHQLYGFAPTQSKVAVYGCNNDLLLNASSIVSRVDLLRDSLTVLVACTTTERLRRLRRRYGSIRPEDGLQARRLTETAPALRASCDVIVDGEAATPELAAAEFVALVFRQDW